MNTTQQNEASLLPWKMYLTITVESLLTFYLATFCLIMFFTHRGMDWMLSSILLAILYAFVIFACIKRLILTLPIPGLMLIVPLAPLIAIIILISLIPILQKF